MLELPWKNAGKPWNKLFPYLYEPCHYIYDLVEASSGRRRADGAPLFSDLSEDDADAVMGRGEERRVSSNTGSNFTSDILEDHVS